MVLICLYLILAFMVALLLLTIAICLSLDSGEQAAGKLIIALFRFLVVIIAEFLKHFGHWMSPNLSITLEASADDNILWIYRGYNTIKYLNDIITYNISANSWSIPSIRGAPLALMQSAISQK